MGIVVMVIGLILMGLMAGIIAMITGDEEDNDRQG